MKNNRNLEIVELRKQGWTMESIAQKYSITRERVRQIIARYEFKNSKIKMSAPSYTLKDIAKLLEASQERIRKYCEQLHLGNNDGRIHRLYSEEDVNKIREAMMITCPCGNKYCIDKDHKSPIYCSRECKEKFTEGQRSHLYKNPPVYQHVIAICEAMKDVPPLDDYVPYSVATKLCKVGFNVFYNLAARKVLASKPSGVIHGPTKTPRMLYSKNQAEAIGRVMDEMNLRKSLEGLNGAVIFDGELTAVEL